jgi:hypothetical protein
MATQVQIDSRKFLGIINDSAQSKIALFEQRVDQLGKSAGKSWRLAALHPSQLFIEDVDTHKYYIADHNKEGHGKVTIANIRELKIVEGEKEELFSESCYKLVCALEDNNQRGMQVAFDRMKAQRFSSRVVPSSGNVKGRDGVLRHINIADGGKTFNESDKDNLIFAIVEGLKNNVIVENGEIVGGSFNDGEPINLPITKWATRKLVAKKMLEAAKNAYWSNGFQTRIYNTAKLISESKIDEAVKQMVPFLDEMEEFTLLNRDQTQSLVENALAANSVFTQQLCDDTATLMFRTNMKISRNKIIDEWRHIAKKTENAALAENVNLLENAKNFESAYQKFLHLIFENISNREITAEALATTLDNLKAKTPKIKESHDLSSKLDNLISRLKGKGIDDSAIFEAEDLIATIQEELAASDSLQSFDQIPGDASSMGGAPDMGQNAPSGAPVININSPLIQIGGTSSAAGDEEDVTDMEMPPPPSEEENMDELLGATPPAPGAAPPAPGAPPAPPAPGGAPPAPGAPPAAESRMRYNFLNESRPMHYEMKKECDDDLACDEEDELEESYDPYAVRAKVEKSAFMHDYGSPVLTDQADINKAVKVMQRLTLEHSLKGQKLYDNIQRMAAATIDALGIRVPKEKMPMAVEQLVNVYFEEASGTDECVTGHERKKPKSIDKDQDGVFDWDEEDEGVAEDQYRSPSIPKQGYKKASINKMDESISWKRSQEDAMLGEWSGVNFIFDHGGNSNLPPIILSEDGAVEIPIPAEIVNSAFAAAGMVEGDGTDFTNWLSESIEQLRPMSDEEDMELNQAMATIMTKPDGSLAINVSGDVEVNHEDEGMEDEDMEDEMGDEMGDEDMEDEDMEEEDMEDADMEDEMKPVETVDSSKVEMDSEDEESEMPDFLKDKTMDSDEEEVDEDEDEGFAEDNDITDPKNAKYTKHVKDNYREVPDHKVPKKSDDQLQSLGPDMKCDDGTGTKPPVARKGH